ncbi:glycosyltransferase family 2 protein [Pinibacter aurantiacus]|uniref:Glycosyltransferase family 2 protein n=1 Tax=Pinibacter aurantiacus TaxID=2851599 RepID=A0A9E2W5S0_9BACT|nr:glycosyltransferase family 2 protein [Pinibacter aurantiacus]MBV4359179.1 glycosyltransferase family 2 protein [Pinibacter aurantiacus]
MSKVSVYIIGYNEEKKIAAAVNSVVNWADEVIVIDSYSTDKTAEIATNLGAKVVQVAFEGFGKLRNDAMKFCNHPWIFSLDSDERCTPEAAAEILKIVRADDQNGPVAYFVPRRNYFMGQKIKFSGWYPDYRQPQLFRTGKMTYSLSPVHEEYEVHGKTGKLHNYIWQYPFENLAQMMHKANRYSTLGAQKYLHKKKGGLRPALSHGIWSFLQTYFFRGGILDGRAGFAIAFYDFYYTFYKYLKLKELQAGWKEPENFNE